MAKPLNILISGAGIAGSSFALCLLRGYPNATITIVERAPILRLTGASVDIRNSAVDIIEWLGIEPEIRNHATGEQGIACVRADGRPFATFRATGRSDVQSITSEYEIFRGALADILFAPIRDRVRLVLNDSVERYDQVADKVNVTLARSQRTESFDLLVAADGLRSRTRGLMLGAPPREQIYDEGVHVAYFTIDQHLLGESRLARQRNMTRGRCVLLRPDPHPAGRTRANLMNITWRRDTAMKARLNTALDEGSESYMRLLEELYGDDADWLTPEVLRGMRASNDFYCSLFGQVRTPILHDGRIVLLGDAGYATPGFGTSLAIIGGYVLAGELLRHPSDPVAALAQYEKLMSGFVKASQQNDIAMQLVNPQSQWCLNVRDAVFWFVTATGLDQLVILAAAKLGFAEKSFALPDYPWAVPTEKK